MTSSSARAQVLVANDDSYGLPQDLTFILDAPGVLDNDLLDEGGAGDGGVIAEVAVDVSHGTLVLNPNGSFSYTRDATFDGSDSFVYRAIADTATAEATVTLSACSGGPDVFDCWSETEWLALAAQHGLSGFTESFEAEDPWGTVRTPSTAPSVSNHGIVWTTNYTGDPVLNKLSTTPGPPRTGLWAVYDPNHGYATGTVTSCDIDNPPESCLYHDGWTGVVDAGQPPLAAVGGYVDASGSGAVEILIDNAPLVGGGKVSLAHQFFGVIDLRPGGFTRFEFREIDGKIGNAVFIFGDDFTMLRDTVTPVRDVNLGGSRVNFAGAFPNPHGGSTTMRFSLTRASTIELSIYDQRGRLVRNLAHESMGVGDHAIQWNGLDARGEPVSAGLYFARLSTESEDDGARDLRVKKMMILR